MKKLKVLAVALGAVAVTSSALAIPTLTISDGLTSVTLNNASGIVTYNNPTFDASWSVVISTAETKPALGSAALPIMDINAQVTSMAATPQRNLTISFSDVGFGPTASFAAILSGHVIAGTGANVTYNTFYDALNSGNPVTSLTTSGTLPGPTYASTVGGGAIAANYSLTQVITVNGSTTAGGSYSLDASLTGVVPDGGTTVMLLGAALSGLALLRRKIA
jgi:hypothetical protein